MGDRLPVAPLNRSARDHSSHGSHAAGASDRDSRTRVRSGAMCDSARAPLRRVPSETGTLSQTSSVPHPTSALNRRSNCRVHRPEASATAAMRSHAPGSETCRMPAPSWASAEAPVHAFPGKVRFDHNDPSLKCVRFSHLHPELPEFVPNHVPSGNGIVQDLFVRYAEELPPVRTVAERHRRLSTVPQKRMDARWKLCAPTTDTALRRNLGSRSCSQSTAGHRSRIGAPARATQQQDAQFQRAVFTYPLRIRSHKRP